MLKYNAISSKRSKPTLYVLCAIGSAIVIALVSRGIYHHYFDDYNTFTPSFISEGTGLEITEYEVLEKYDNKQMQDDAWGQVFWQIKVAKPVSIKLLNKLVKIDPRWKYQNDISQQYMFFENIEGKGIKTISVYADNLTVLTLSHEWKK